MKVISLLPAETNYWNVPEKIEFQTGSYSSGKTEFKLVCTLNVFFVQIWRHLSKATFQGPTSLHYLLTSFNFKSVRRGLMKNVSLLRKFTPMGIEISFYGKNKISFWYHPLFRNEFMKKTIGNLKYFSSSSNTVDIW